MAQTALPNTGLNYEHTLGADYKNSYDANWIIVDTLLQGYVIDSTVSSEPGSPSVGDAYILPSGLSGTNWGSDSGAVEHAIAIYAAVPGLTDDSDWLYLTPREGWTVFDRTNNRRMVYLDSAWRPLPRFRQIDAQASVALPDSQGTIGVDVSGAPVTLDIDEETTTPLPVGFRTTVVDSQGNADANTITIEAAAGVDLNGTTAGTVTIELAYGHVELVKIAGNTWLALA